MPQAFLRRNSGWEQRVAAAREGRRYVPKGGPIKVYTSADDPPFPAKASGSRRPGGRKARDAKAPAAGLPPRGEGRQGAAPRPGPDPASALVSSSWVAKVLGAGEAGAGAGVIGAARPGPPPASGLDLEEAAAVIDQEPAGMLAPAAACESPGAGRPAGCEEGPELESASHYLQCSLQDLPDRLASTLAQKLALPRHGSSSSPGPGGGQGAAAEARPPAPLEPGGLCLQHQAEQLAEERAALAKRRAELNRATARLAAEREELERWKAEERARLEAAVAEEFRRLRRDRRVLEQQSRALLKLPSRREREELAALGAALEEEREAGRGRDARHRLAADRLRAQLELERRTVGELRAQVAALSSEVRQLQTWADPPPEPGVKRRQEARGGGGGGGGSTVGATAAAAELAPGVVLTPNRIRQKPEDPAQPRWTTAKGPVVAASSGRRVAAAAENVQLPAPKAARRPGTSASAQRVGPGSQPLAPHRLHPRRPPEASGAGGLASAGPGSPGPLACCMDLAMPGGDPWPQQAPGAPGLGPGSGTDDDPELFEQRHPDGSTTSLRASGLRLQRFADGVVRREWPDGRSVTEFANGDLKRTDTSGRVDYWFAAVDCWQSTHPGGVEVYYFPSGQVEAHHPGGGKEIMFGDGTLKKLLPDGREVDLTAAHLSSLIQLPCPTAAS